MGNSHRLPFSWPAFLLAPWPVPLTCSALLAFGPPGHQLGTFFFLSLAFALVVSYLGTAALVITLHFVAQARPVTRIVSALVGLILAGLGYLPLLYLMWSGGGPDSGPPVMSFSSYLLHEWDDPILGIFLASGLVTAVLYDTFARRQAKQAPSA